MNPMIAIVVGTRPEIIKMTPIIHALQEQHLDFDFILSGQYDDSEAMTGECQRNIIDEWSTKVSPCGAGIR